MLEILSQILFLILFFGGVFYGVYKGHHLVTRPALARHRARWEQLAQRIGFAFVDKSGINRRRYRLTGRRDGRPVEVRFACEGKGYLASSLEDSTFQAGMERLLVEVPCRAAMPAGLSVQPEGVRSETLKYLGLQDIQLGDATLDHRLEIRGRDPAAVRAFFSDESLRNALVAGLGEGGIELEPGRVRLPLDREAPDAVPHLIERALEIAAAIEASAEAGWKRVADRLGLSQAAFDGTGHRPLSGEIDGLPVKISVVDGADTQVEVRFDAALPLWLRAPGAAVEGEPPRLELPNPVLSRLVEARSDSPEAARILLDDTLTERILAVIGGHPGSVVEPGRVLLVLPGKAGAEALEAGIRDAIALARSLQGG